MTAPYLGGLRILSTKWRSSHSIDVRFSSAHGATYYTQLYAGRTLIGVTGTPLARRVTGQLTPSTYPQHLTLLAVAERATDYGSTLPLRPYNRVRFTFTASSWPADSKLIELRAGTTPGGAVVDANVVGKVLFDTSRDYTIDTPPLAGSGTWNFEAVGIDNRPAAGNEGSALAGSKTILAHPPDVQVSSGTRLSVSATSQQLTVSFTE